MLLFFVLFFLLIVIFSGITTIPLAIALLVVATIVFKKSWVFFMAFGLGLFLDLILIRPLGYTSLILSTSVFLVWLYERKFETQTLTFVFISTFLGSLVYLNIFHYNNILSQSFINAFISILLFKFLWLKLARRSETI